MIWFLVLQLARPYHVETIASMPTCRHTHVAVTGRVILVRQEADGDWHLRLSDNGKRFIVAEIIPTLQPIKGHELDAFAIALPKLNECVEVRGIRRVDTESGHGWTEIHPVEFLKVIPCKLP